MAQHALLEDIERNRHKKDPWAYLPALQRPLACAGDDEGVAPGSGWGAGLAARSVQGGGQALLEASATDIRARVEVSLHQPLFTATVQASMIWPRSGK